MNYNNGQVPPMNPMNEQMQLMQQMQEMQRMQRMQQMGQDMQMPPQMPQMPQMQPQMPPQMPQMPPQMSPQMSQMPPMPQQMPPQLNAYQGGAMPNARPMEPMAQQMAQQGRYGDSMLVHMNPAEVQGIAALSPTGSLTTNPVTGQPEAFLPFLAPLLGSMFGSTLLGGLGSALGTGALGTALTSVAGNAALSGAIGSGLATTLATGDIKKGLLSGITGFGLGKALGAAGDALNPDIANTTAALGDASTAASEAGKNLALTAVETADPIAKAIEMGAAPATNPLTGELINQGFSPAAVTDPLTGAVMNPSALNPSQLAMANPMQKLLGAEGVRNAANANVANLSGRLDSLRGAQTAGDRLLAPFKQPGTFGKALMQPANLAAIGIGEGKIAEIDARELAERDNRRFEEEKQAEYNRAIGNMEGAFDQLESDYAYRDYKIPRMSAGGVASINPQNYADNVRGLQQMVGVPVQMYPGGEIPIGGQGGSGNYNFAPTGRAGSAARQAGIRGTEVISAEELQGTRPGFQPEITYFRAPLPAEDAEVDAGTDGGSAAQLPEYNVDLSGVDLSSLGLGGFNIPDYLSTPEGNATVGTIDEVLNVPADSGSRVNAIPNSIVGRGNMPSANTYEDIVAQTKRGPVRTVGRKDLSTTNFALGGETAMEETLESNGQLLIERTVEAISGQLSEDQASAVVASFIDEFGPEAFQMLREKVLEQIVPGSQKEGEIRGTGGGMDDMIPGMIGNSQPVAVSPGEYIVPADVVSGLGDGSTDAGVSELDQMLDRVRQERTGTLRQPAPMRVGGVLPA
jgi:hypothetical protein